jgi:hypothetical protein
MSMTPDSSHAATDAAAAQASGRRAATNTPAKPTAATTPPMTSRVEPRLTVTHNGLTGVRRGPSPLTGLG